ncbi:MAG: hypothetical protein B7C55_12175 [Actinomycetales bacterium mxb001]|nr:MAG: hypothetical protein B7C55_12175 [Actinomycetales bacterium mxb001]
MRNSIALIGAVLLLAACGGSSTPSESSSSAAPTEAAGAWAVSDCIQISPPTITPTQPLDSVEQGGVATTTAVGMAPTVGISESATPATSLVTLDVVEGSGDAVAAGATVTVDYCGVGLDSGAIFDSSWSRGQPATFPLDGVIAGWQEGIPGMKPGGRRLLIIPGDLAYGPNPPPGSGIGPNETLVFVVDMLSSP